jgi:hypothetical protein
MVKRPFGRHPVRKPILIKRAQAHSKMPGRQASITALGRKALVLAVYSQGILSFFG